MSADVRCRFAGCQDAAAQKVALDGTLPGSTATPESRGLTHGEQARQRFSGTVQNPALQISLQAAKALAADEPQPDCDQWPGLAVPDRL